MSDSNVFQDVLNAWIIITTSVLFYNNLEILLNENLTKKVREYNEARREIENELSQTDMYEHPDKYRFLRKVFSDFKEIKIEDYRNPLDSIILTLKTVPLMQKYHNIKFNKP